MKKLNEVKNVITHATYVLNGPIFNLLFYCHVILYEVKVTSYVKFSHNLTFEVQTIWKILLFQYYWWKYWNTEKLLNFEKFQLKWKIVKLFKRPKQTATFRNLFSLRHSPCHQKKSYYVFKTKIFLGNIQKYTEICFQNASGK